MGRYVGIDPSTKTGVVILNSDGEVLDTKEIKTTLKTDPHRFMDIAETVADQLERPDKVFIEGFSYASKGRGVSTQYGVGWMIRAEIVGMEMSYTEITPGSLKKFASGKGNTKKDELVLPIYKKWGFESSSDNIRDAYVMAQIGRYMDGLEEPTKYQEDVLKKLRGA